MGQLPEQVQANLATLQRLQLEQQSVVGRPAQGPGRACCSSRAATPTPAAAAPGLAPPTRSLEIAARRSRSCARATPTSTPT